MNDIAREVRVFDGAAPADRHRLGPGRPSDVPETRGTFGVRIEFVAHPSFDDPDARDAILAPMPGHSDIASAGRDRVPDGVCPEFACLYEVSLLSREQEAHQFRKMNCLKHLAEQARSRLGSSRSRRHDLEEIERLRNEAVAVKQQIIRANLRLVVSIARRFVGRYGDFAELISIGNLALIRAVDKFDFARGCGFSTYATWSIRNEFRSVRRERRLVLTDTATLPDTVDMRDDPGEQQLAQDRRERIVAYLLGRLDERERRILVGRFGIGGARQETLGQLGGELGISKERVPQIEVQARNRLRRIARTEGKAPLPA